MGAVVKEGETRCRMKRFPGNAGRPVDVCFLLEGTYPYIRGGVSSWVHQMLSEAPGLTFGLFFIGANREAAGEFAYEIPSNVREFEEVFLFDEFPAEELETGQCDDAELELLFDQQAKIYLAENEEDRIASFWRWLDVLERSSHPVTFGDLTRGEPGWDLLHTVVDRYLPNEPFTAIYFTWIYLHSPIWKLIRACGRIPAARVYHSLCTGYAGLSGSIASRKTGASLLISEHGVYVKERVEEINQATWIHDPGDDFPRVDTGLAPLKRAWVEMFQFLGRIAYRQAGTVTTLYARNRNLQIEFGCPPEKLRIIPNGIDPERYSEARRKRAQRLSKQSPRTVGFIGRVVSIKDVKTLIRAMDAARQVMPEICLRLIGPTDEEEAYFQECEKMIDLLDLGGVISVEGRQNVLEVIDGIDVMVLTSISEGLPFVILEGYAAGIPSVATDVGSCRELIFGNQPDDKAIGSGGRLTKIGNPEATARALVELLSDPQELRRAGEAGLERLRRFYSEEEVMGTYRSLYDSLPRSKASRANHSD